MFSAHSAAEGSQERLRASGTNNACVNGPVHHTFVILANVCQCFGSRRRFPCSHVTHGTIFFPREVNNVESIFCSKRQVIGKQA